MYNIYSTIYNENIIGTYKMRNNFWKAKNFLLLFAINKEERATTIARAIVGRAITKQREIKKRSKELILEVKLRKLRAITLQEKNKHQNCSAFWVHQQYFRGW